MFFSPKTMGILFVLAMAQGQAQDLILRNGVKPHEGVDAIYKAFSEGYRTLEASLVAKAYTENAAYLSPGSEIVYGRSVMLEKFSSWFESMKAQDRKMTIQFEIFQRQISGDLGYDVGVYTLHYYTKEGKVQSEHKGKFVVVLTKEDGKWRFQVDGYSDITPPE